MAIEINEQYHLETLRSVQERDVQDYVGLLEVLTEIPQEIDQVRTNLQRAVNSDTTTVFAVRRDQDGSVVSTATLNRLPVLSKKNSVMWIDDVVTHPSAQYNGLSKLTMDAMENEARRHASEVLLTSSPDRGPARTGYTKRGYELYPGDLSVFRNSKLELDPIKVTQPELGYSKVDIISMAELLEQDTDALELNLQNVLASAFSAVFARRVRGKIAAIAVANLCPIPTGFKPWVDDLAGLSHSKKLRVLSNSEQWLAQNQAPYVNVVAESDIDLSEAYEKRASGLFIKQLNDDSANDQAGNTATDQEVTLMFRRATEGGQTISPTHRHHSGGDRWSAHN